MDILNIMGPAIAATAWLWGACRTPRTRTIAFGAATVAIAFATPAVRAAGWLAPLPDVLEAYLRPTAGLSNFVAFPWVAFVPAGAVLGTWIDRALDRRELRLNAGFVAAGTVLASGAFALSYLPPVAGASYFWTSSPAFFFLRSGVMCIAVGLAYFWERRPPRWRARWSPLQVLGRHSLFIYWIHVELVYGLVSTPLHQALSLQEAWGGLALFTILMVGCAVLKDRWRPGVPGQGQSRPARLEMSSNFS